MRKKTLIEELIEVSDPELDDKIVKSFHKKTELSSDIFEKNDYGYTMNKGVREKLMLISDAFLDFVKINFFVHDVVLTGSLANYNWSEFSDIDLHIVVDFDELGKDAEKTSDSLKDIVKEFFDAKERVWNNRHDIKIKGYDVEIYVQEINQEHVSSKVYSILNNINASFNLLFRLFIIIILPLYFFIIIDNCNISIIYLSEYNLS